MPLSVLPKEQGKPEALAAVGATLDPLAVGLALRFVVHELQVADAVPRALHLATDAVTTRAAQRGSFLRHYVYPSIRGLPTHVYSRVVSVARGARAEHVPDGQFFSTSRGL